MDSQGLEYKKVEGGYSVCGIGDCDDMRVSIPSVHEGEPVVEVGDGAFEGCDTVLSVDIPDGVVRIGRHAFSGSLIRDVAIPGSVKQIGCGAFERCHFLNGVRVPDIAAWCGIWFLDGDANPLSYARMLYVDGMETYDIEIPEGVNAISSYAFYKYNALVGVTLPKSLKSIGTNAFNHCYKLVEVRNFSSVGLVAGSEQNGHVAQYAKRICATGESSKICRDEGDFIFYDAGDALFLMGYVGMDTELVLPSGIERNYEICNDAFRGMDNLTGVTIPEGVTAIGDYAFSRCESLERVTIGNDVSTVGECAFNCCTFLEDVEFGEGVKTIGRAAFGFCRTIKDIFLPEGLKYIGEDAFGWCLKLKRVTIPGSVEYIGRCAFNIYYGCDPYENLAVRFLGGMGTWASIAAGHITNREGFSVICDDG